MKTILTLLMLILAIVVSAAEPLKDQSISLLLLGDELSINLLIASWVMAFIGMVTIWFIDLQITIIKNWQTGISFSIKYWWHDNGARAITDFLLSFLVLFAIMRFHGKYSENELTMWLPYCIGAGIDAAIAAVRRFSPFNGFNGKQ